ncbi:MAG: hypothetical protein KDC38_03800 [Planctomycetes bacterium]|nr:hypothetical protein [Planctomycetota bacterium]
MSLPYQHVLDLADPRRAALEIAEWYLDHLDDRVSIREGWKFDREWDFPKARQLAADTSAPARVIRDVTVALVYSSIVECRPDLRDHLVLMSLAWHALEAVGADPRVTFGVVASASSGECARAFQDFTARPTSKRAIGAFGWRAIETETGLEFDRI